MNKNIKKLTAMSMLAAISIILVYFIRFPIFPSAPFLEYDPADISIMIGTFIFGPISGLILTAVVSVVQGITVSAESGPIGIIMHFLATGMFVLIAGMIYQKKKTVLSMVIALLSGVAAMTLTMALLNIIIMPIYMGGVSVKVVLGMMIPVIIPFNLIKASVNAIMAFVIFKALNKVIKRQFS